MRALIVHPFMSLYGGAELVIVKLANYLTKNGIDNAILTLSISPEIRGEIMGSDVIIPKRTLKLPRFDLPLVALALIKHARKNIKGYDIVNVHNFPAEFVAFSCTQKVIWMCNEPPQQYFTSSSTPVKLLGEIITFIDKFVVKNYIDFVCVADKFNARRFEKIYGVKPVIIPYGIDFEFFSKGNRKKAMEMFGLCKEDFVLLQVGMLTPLKNQLESIKVVNILKNKIPNIKLILAGHGNNEYEKILRKYVHEFELERHVIFTGHLPRTAIRDLYAACNLCLFPVKPQGGWLSPFEALCMGKPIIVSTQMTAAELIEKNKIGTVTDDFSKVVMDMYNNPKKYQRAAKRGKRWVKANLSWDMFGRKMLKLFEL